MVAWAVEAVRRVAETVVVALPAEHLDSALSIFRGWDGVRCVVGGASRWESVSIAFEQLTGEETDLVAVHDGARPAVSTHDLRAVIEAAEITGAAILGRRVTDTVKRLSGDTVIETVDRADLFRAETPQVFERRWLSRARDLARRRGLEPTDESFLVELLGEPLVTAVEARHPNPKITQPSDLRRVEALLGATS